MQISTLLVVSIFFHSLFRYKRWERRKRRKLHCEKPRCTEEKKVTSESQESTNTTVTFGQGCVTVPRAHRSLCTYRLPPGRHGPGSHALCACGRPCGLHASANGHQTGTVSNMPLSCPVIARSDTTTASYHSHHHCALYIQLLYATPMPWYRSLWHLLPLALCSRLSASLSLCLAAISFKTAFI